MWFTIENLNKYKKIELAGKALLLCQKYEFTCKSLNKWISMSADLKVNKYKLFNDTTHRVDEKAISESEKLLANFYSLNRSIDNLKKKSKQLFNRDIINEDTLEKLKKAKDSRNSICHDYYINQLKMIELNYEVDIVVQDKLEEDINNVIIGDCIVSGLLLSFLERYPYWKDEDDYVKLIWKWIAT